VKKMAGLGCSVMDVSRMSEIHIFRELQKPQEKERTGPYRFNAVPTQSGIMKQVAAILKENVNRTIANQTRRHEPGSRSSPRKKKQITKPSQSKPSKPEPEPEKDPGSSTLFIEEPEPESRVDLNFINPILPQEEEQDASQEEESHSQSPGKVSAPRNAFEVLKSARAKPAVKTKKLTKKVSKNQKLDQSSICEPALADKINGNGRGRKRVQTKKKIPRADKNMSKVAVEEKSRSKVGSGEKNRKNSSDKENTGKEADMSNTSVFKTYRTKKDKPSVSFDQSIPSSPKHKKPTQKEKKLDSWAALQTSHFSEVEEFDLSFS
jgi:hypothetical protein